ncbi:PspA/IM30 family protein [Blastomonas fulva]|uniref:PspA/IM30 family protein n=1 Tax=Blastomonas fulva TaxID=1550728 RepID=UPI003F6F70B8
MGIFSRTRDIIAANVTELLDKAEDPAKMIRMIILEMEETLVEVRASAARTIADQKEMKRHVGKLEQLQADWTDKAELALSKDREDLARAALLEKKKAADMADQLNVEINVLDDALRASEEDIAKLQAKLREARMRQNNIMSRLESAENRVDLLERRVDMAEGRADALGMAEDERGERKALGQRSLDDEFAALAGSDKVDEELEAMKRALKKEG